MSDSILVTGAAGFIGSHLAVSLIKLGHQVIGIDNFDPFYARELKHANIQKLDPSKFQLHEVDICDVASLKQVFEETRPEMVYHIAAMAGVRPSIERPERYAAVNVRGLANVLDAARYVGCKDVVFASSSSVYGNASRIPFAEDEPACASISPYAATKRAGEWMCETYASSYGMSIGIVRLFTVFGPAQRPDLAIAKFFRLIANDLEVPMFGDGSTSRDYTYVDDIVTGILAAGEYIRDRNDFVRVWNLGHSQPITLIDMIEQIGEVVGKHPRIKKLPIPTGDVQHTYADVTRSNTDLSYDAKTPFIDGLKLQWAWIQNRDMAQPMASNVS